MLFFFKDGIIENVTFNCVALQKTQQNWLKLTYLCKTYKVAMLFIEEKASSIFDTEWQQMLSKPDFHKPGQKESLSELWENPLKAQRI